jgi:hypothetical protein
VLKCGHNLQQPLTELDAAVVKRNRDSHRTVTLLP